MYEQQVLPAALDIADDVAHALEEGQAVVALETAVATHGLPHPRNMEALASMVAEIEQSGAVPAICMVDNGALCVGAALDRVEDVAKDPNRQKASVRDLGYMVARRRPAGLTVSATVFAAHLAGIQVLATGGIGGVHRDVAGSGDVSADLHQLARTPVVTVCSGAKSVLDIPRTLEYLESLGVPVFSYRTSFFPAFYLTSSGIATTQVDSPQQIAEIALAGWALGHPAGIVVGQPIPAESAISEQDWSQLLAAAEQSSRAGQVRGRDVTPYLLNEVAAGSGGRTVDANLSLLRRNAHLAAEIARALVIQEQAGDLDDDVL